MTRFRLAASAPAIALFACITLPCAALAQEAAPEIDRIGDLLLISVPAPAAEAAAQAAESGDKVLASDDLEAISGGATDISDSALSNQELTATNSHNTVGGDVDTGDIRFTDGAFANFSGVGNVVVNTGVQANIQGSINVTINGTSF